MVLDVTSAEATLTGYSSCFSPLMLKKSLLLSLLLVSTSSQAYIGGSHPQKGSYPSTVYMSTLGYDFCSGVVVGKRMVLTAAHCVTGWTKSKMGENGSLDLVTNSMENSWDSINAPIKAVYVHPSWPEGFDVEDKNSQQKYNISAKDIAKIYDLAMIQFERDLDLPVATIDTSPIKIGESATFGGFGCRNDRQEGRGTLYVALKKIEKYSQNDLVSGQKNVNDGQNSSICNGDSGGPVYRGTSQNRVVGINSLSSQFWIFKFGNYAVRLDTPNAQSWIHSVFKGKAKTFPLPRDF